MNREIATAIDHLFRNAMVFLERSVEEAKAGDVRFAIVHFSQAVELLLKCRLAKEHWTLVVSDADRATLESFLEGHAHTVSAKKAMLRLEQVLSIDLSSLDKAVSKLTTHRNRVVHFYHKSLEAPETTKEQQELVAEMCAVWHHLHGWLTGRWRGQFLTNRPAISEVHDRMLSIRTFLEARHHEIKRELLDWQSKSDFLLHPCAACGFDSVMTAQTGMWITNRCAVCEWTHEDRGVRCPANNCKGVVSVQGLGSVIPCNACETKPDLKTVMDSFEEQQSTKPQAFCWMCEKPYQTVFEDRYAASDKYTCLACGAGSEALVDCSLCGEHVAYRATTAGRMLVGAIICSSCQRSLSSTSIDQSPAS